MTSKAKQIFLNLHPHSMSLTCDGPKKNLRIYCESFYASPPVVTA